MHLLIVNLRISNRVLRYLCQSTHTPPYSMALAIKFVQVCPYHLMESIPVVCRSQLMITCICCYCSVTKLYLTLCDSMDCSCQASLFMDFPGKNTISFFQESFWPGDQTLQWQVDFLPLSPREAWLHQCQPSHIWSVLHVWWTARTLCLHIQGGRKD